MKLGRSWAARFGIAALLPALLVGCDGRTTAHVDCGLPQTVETRLGILNTAGLQLGSLFVVNTATRKARPLGTFAPVLNEMSRTAREADVRLPITAGLAVLVDAPDEAPEALVRHIRSLVAGGSEIRLWGRQSRSIFNVDYYFEERGTLLEEIVSLPPPVSGQDVVFLVTTETTAEQVSIGLAESPAKSGEPVSMTLDDYTLEVEYRGLPPEFSTGAKGPALVRVTPLRYLPDDGKIVVDVTQELDLSSCDLSQAAKPR